MPSRLIPRRTVLTAKPVLSQLINTNWYSLNWSTQTGTLSTDQHKPVLSQQINTNWYSLNWSTQTGTLSTDQHKPVLSQMINTNWYSLKWLTQTGTLSTDQHNPFHLRKTEVHFRFYDSQSVNSVSSQDESNARITPYILKWFQYPAIYA